MSLREELEDLNALIASLDEKREDLLRQRREVYRRSLEAADEADKVATDSMAEMLAEEPLPPRWIQYPVEISAIAWDDSAPPVWNDQLAPTGRWVRVRPCGAKYENKTFLGILLGSLARGISARLNNETKVLHLGNSFHNPAIFVPDLNEVIWGMGSWWGVIETPEDLKSLTDTDIENVWYVRALRDLCEGKPAHDD